MDYKLIVLDLDDTLVLPDGTVSPENRHALLEAQRRGVRVALASGRPTYAMHAVAETLELARYGGYVVSFNGGHILRCQDNRVVHWQCLTRRQVERLYHLSQEQGVYLLTYTDSQIITPASCPYIEIESQITKMPLVECADFMSAVPERVTKAMMLDDPERLRQVEQSLRPVVEGEFSMAISKPFFLEFMHTGVDKGEAVRRLCQYMDIDISQSIAMGDSYNDLTMIKAAGLGVAMANAVQDIKDCAGHISASCEDHGVAQAVHQFVLC